MMSLSNLLGKWNRSLFSTCSIAVPTMLLVFFLFITFRLKGILYTTWLGQYVSLQVGKAQYIAVCIALGIAILTTAEIIWQNVSERGPEISLLKAVGWRNQSVRVSVLLEGMFTGVIAGILGILLGLALIVFMYRQVPFGDLWFIALTGVIPMMVGTLGAWLPAQIAARVVPGQGMRGVAG